MNQLLTKSKIKLKWFWFDVLMALGYRISFNRHKGSTRVLCFHGICHDDQHYINGRFIKHSKIKSLLRILSIHYNILSMKDFVQNNMSSDKLNILLTFDDGYRNLKFLLLPIINELEIPVTLFINLCQFHWMDYLDIINYNNSLDALSEIFPLVKRKSEIQIKAWAKEQNKETIQSFKIALLKIAEPYLDEYRIFHQLAFQG